MQDTLVFIMGQGFSLDMILNLDLDAFRSLADSCRRVFGTKIELLARTIHFGSQGDSKEFEKFIKSWIGPLRDMGKKPIDDLDKALNVLGSGF